MSHTAAFDELLAEQPSDWAFFEVYVTLDDPRRLADARVALARANARPMRVAGRPRLRDHGRPHPRPRRRAPACVRSALRILDDRDITGRTWGGETRTLVRPAPPHRYGP